MISIVTEEMKAEILALDKKGLSNKEIGLKLGIKQATAGYWKTKLRKNGKAKSKNSLSPVNPVIKEKHLNECFREEFIMGFVKFNDKTYITTSSGIALEVKGEINMVSKEEMDNIKNAIKKEFEDACARMEFINEMEKGV